MKTTFIYPEEAPLILGSRIFNAPRDLVWEASTAEKHLAKWWGPRRYTTSVDKWDFRVGGKWGMTHKGGDDKGGDFKFFGDFLEIEPKRRFTWTFGFGDFPGGPETYNFEDIGNGQTLLWTVSNFGTMEAREGMRSTDMESGASETYERLDELLTKLRAN